MELTTVLCIFSKNSVFDLELCDAHGSGIVRTWDVMVSQAFFNGGNFRNRPVVVPEQDQHVRTAVVDGVRTYLHRFYNGLLYLVLAGIQPHRRSQMDMYSPYFRISLLIRGRTSLCNISRSPTMSSNVLETKNVIMRWPPLYCEL